MYDIIIVNCNKETEKLQKKFPHAQVIDYQDNILDIVKTARKNVLTEYFWVIYSWCDYDNFNFNWRPPWHQEDQIHCWSDYEKGGYTLLIPTKKFDEQNIDQLQDYQYICWHKQSIALNDQFDVFIMDMGGHDSNVKQLVQQFPNAKVLRYIDTHKSMIKRASNHATTPYFWIISSCCDYNNFDFDWRPSWETQNQIHCWASGKQIFGDTFLIPKDQFQIQFNQIEKLEYFDSICWHDNGVDRLEWPINYCSTDLLTSINSHIFSSVYEYFIVPGSVKKSDVDCKIWEKRHLIAYNKNGHVSLVPRDAKAVVKNKVLDYNYIQYHSCNKSTQKPQDIVFISYDEENANENWNTLSDKFPQSIRIDKVDGMINALKISADKSSTPWFYAVFAKTKIYNTFNFDFNPNYLELPKNYIFYAYNEITKNTYGHGGVVMYHSQSVLDKKEWNFDFTTSFPCENIPLVSCINSAGNEFEAWRTSFREVLKLKDMNTIESQYRLHCWLKYNETEFGIWSIKGAKDALDFDDDIFLANDWNWLKQKFNQACL